MPTYKALYSFGPYEGDFEFTFATEKTAAEFRELILDKFIQLNHVEIDKFEKMMAGCEDSEILIEQNRSEFDEKIQFIQEHRQEFLNTGMISHPKSYRSIGYRQIDIVQF